MTVDVKFRVDTKTAKKAMAMLEMDIPADDEIVKKLHNLTIDLTGDKDSDVKQAELGFILIAIGKAFSEETA